MQILIDGFEVFFKNFLAIGLLLITASGLGIVCLNLMAATRQLPPFVKVILGVVLGLIPLTLLSYLIIFASSYWPFAAKIGAFGLVGAGAISLLVFLVRAKIWRTPRKTWLIAIGGLIAFFVYLSLRLAFIKGLVLPPYNDSVEHYRILTGFLDSQTVMSILGGKYYHYGFHSLTAWIVTITGMDPAAAISLTGQMLLSLVPVSVFGLVYVIDFRWRPALLTALYASFLFSMPAHAVNWGKFPAMAALTVFPATLAVLVVIWRHQCSPKRVLQLVIAWTALLAGITFFHSRALLCGLIVISCLAIGDLWFADLQIRTRRITAFVSLFAFLLPIFLNRSMLWLYATPVFPFVICLVFVLVCAFYRPGVTFAASVSGLVIFLLTYLPAPGIVRAVSEYWMDTPFYQILLFLPLSVMAALGMDALKTIIWNSGWKRFLLPVGYVAIFIALAFTQSYKPADCCNFVSEDDLTTIRWIEANLPADAQVAIPERTDLTPSRGADAGIWITSLTGRETILLPYDYVWFKEKFHTRVCRMGVVYIFSSTFSTSFQINQDTHPDWYQVVFESGGDTVYRVIGCGE